MGHDGLLIGEVAKRRGASRKALRLYEEAGILPAPRRTQSGYRVYSSEALDLLAFLRQAQRLGFTLDEIKEIVAIKRAGRAPCLHVRELVQRKAEELNQRLLDLTTVRNGLRALLSGWRRTGKAGGVVCPHIEHASRSKKGRKRVIGLVLIATVVVTAGAAVAQQSAQQPGTPPPGHQMPTQGGMCPMMGEMMGGGGMMSGMMGMLGGRAESPRMLQMRGEMLKAMGEIMMKYGKMTEGGPR